MLFALCHQTHLQSTSNEIYLTTKSKLPNSEKI